MVLVAAVVSVVVAIVVSCSLVPLESSLLSIAYLVIVNVLLLVFVLVLNGTCSLGPTIAEKVVKSDPKVVIPGGPYKNNMSIGYNIIVPVVREVQVVLEDLVSHYSHSNHLYRLYHSFQAVPVHPKTILVNKQNMHIPFHPWVQQEQVFLLDNYGVVSGDCTPFRDYMYYHGNMFCNH
jgi:hypothetical protein